MGKESAKMKSLLAFSALDDDQANRESCLEQYGELADHIEEHGQDSESPVFDDFYTSGGEVTIATLTNFSSLEFNHLWRIVMPHMTASWTLGRGRKPSVLPKDALFATLVVPKHYESWDKHGIDLNIRSSTQEKTVQKVIDIDIAGPILYDHFVKPVDMASQNENGLSFANYPYALYATDVKFQPAFIECSVAPPGIAVDVTKHYPGSKADVSILHENIDAHKKQLQKSESELRQADYGELCFEYPELWAVLVDIGPRHPSRGILEVD
ncbi:hypothetical protein Ae201684P_019887 [Aphanomyces euteiches]|nr:hypothetical protein Ae201684P_019887 [Aphanomyces euteiches]